VILENPKPLPVADASEEVEIIDAKPKGDIKSGVIPKPPDLGYTLPPIPTRLQMKRKALDDQKELKQKMKMKMKEELKKQLQNRQLPANAGATVARKTQIAISDSCLMGLPVVTVVDVDASKRPP